MEISWQSFIENVGGTNSEQYNAIVDQFYNNPIGFEPLLTVFSDALDAGIFADLLSKLQELSTDPLTGYYRDVYVDGNLLNLASFLPPDFDLSHGFDPTIFTIYDIKSVALIHFSRNLLNETPPYADVVDNANEYIWLEQSKNVFHTFPNDETGEDFSNTFKVLKVNDDGSSSEMIFQEVNGSFVLVSDPRNAASYNFANAGDGILDAESLLHNDLDVRTWSIFGNSIDDPSSFFDRDAYYRPIWLFGDLPPTSLPEDLEHSLTVVSGTDGDDILEGSGQYTFTMIGYDGDDFFYSGPQQDFINGGFGFSRTNDGFDIVSYSDSYGAVAVNLGLEFSRNGEASYDNLPETLISIEGVIGSNFGDILIGSDVDNLLGGGGGTDILRGGIGDDTLNGGTGDDTLTGGRDDDVIIGGDGINTAVYTGNRADYEIADLRGTYVSEDESAYIISSFDTADAGWDFLTGIQRVQFADGTWDIDDLVTQSNDSDPVDFSSLSGEVEDFSANIVGWEAQGIQIVDTPLGFGAEFSYENESRLLYPYAGENGFPRSGTLEITLNVDSGYQYRDRTFFNSESRAIIFGTDISGGDVTWPGSAWLYVNDDGTISFRLATSKEGGQSQPGTFILVENTDFAMDEWHTISISFGSEGMALALNGEVLGTNINTQTLAGGGTHYQSFGQPTIGEGVPSAWSNNRWEGGFNGVVEAVRISEQQMDFQLADAVANAHNGDVVVVPEDTHENDVLSSGDTEQIYLAEGPALVKGGAAALDGDEIYGFDEDDTLMIFNSSFERSDMRVTMGSAILDIDTNQDGEYDTQVTLKGDFEGAEFDVSSFGPHTEITLIQEPDEPSIPNTPPTLNILTSLSVTEGFDGVVLALVASDIDGDPLTFSLSGQDAAQFQLDGTNVRFVNIPDFEAPTDTNTDNAYQITVSVSDGQGGTDSTFVSVFVNSRPQPEPEPETTPEPVNRVLTAMDDEIMGRSGWLLEGNIFDDNGNGRDFDPEGDDITLVMIDGENIVFGTPIGLDSGASLVIQSDGSFVYDQRTAHSSASDGVAPDDSFTYTIRDEAGATSEATVEIELGDAPSAPELSLLHAFYQIAFGREADEEGFEFWEGIREGGMSTDDIANFFATSEEFYSSRGNADTTTGFLLNVYENAFDRFPDIEGFNFWASALEGGFVDRGDIVNLFANSQEMQSTYLAEGFSFV